MGNMLSVANAEQQGDAAYNPQITVEQLDLELKNKRFCQKKQFLGSVHVTDRLRNISSEKCLLI